MVRDVAARLNAEPRIDAYVVESENFESIHNHSAYALIENDKAQGYCLAGCLTPVSGPKPETGAEAPRFSCRKPANLQRQRLCLARQLFLDPRRLARTLAQVVQLGATHITTTLDFDRATSGE
jgi:hypothetical protein